jgi:hypothetical protein
MPRASVFLLCAIAASISSGCAKHELRGKSVRSADGKTYLVVEDNNGGGCGAILVDRRAWPYPLHAAGEIQPGSHQIACGDPDYFIEFSIEAGRTFHFDYWGP